MDPSQLTEGEFQRECQELWDRFALCHVGSFVEPLLELSDGFREEHYEALREALQDAAGNAHPEENFLDEDGDVDECARDEAIEAYVDENEREPMEYYSVDRWLAARLREQSEAVLEYGNHYVWIRCSTGQSTYMDECMRQITRDYLESRAVSLAD
jgi:hypothetical protein